MISVGWTGGLVVVPRQMQGRSRLIAGTASMGKSVDGEREAGGTDVKQWQAQMAYRAWRVGG